MVENGQGLTHKSLITPKNYIRPASYNLAYMSTYIVTLYTTWVDKVGKYYVC